MTDMRRQYLQEAQGPVDAEKAAAGGIAGGEKISKSTLELAGGAATSNTPEGRFWQRQQSQAETIAVGRKYISQAAPKVTKETKKEL
jgi:anoctamin-10